MQDLQKIHDAVQSLKSKLQGQPKADTAVILGTGLGEWVDKSDVRISLTYDEIPGFPSSTVESHNGRLALTMIREHPIFVLQGRFHLYEGYTPFEVCLGVRVLKMLGATNLIVTNAAGAINPLFDAGDLMLVTDHINFTGQTPLTGVNDESMGPRFPDMSRVYDKTLQELACTQARKLGIRLEKGVYIGVSGPSLETPAETRALRILGADAVGMSTVMEVIAARHMGMKVLGISCLTNKNLPDCMAETSLEEIIASAKRSAGKLSKLLNAIIENM